MAGRTRKSAKNIAYNMAYQILGIVLKFVSRTVFIRTLGVAYLGINGLFTEVLQLLSMADMGFNTAMVYSLYQPLAQRDERRIAQLIAAYKKIYTVIALTVTAIGIGLMPWLKYLVHLEKPMPHMYQYYLLYLANTVASYLVIYRTSILTADQKNYLISRYSAMFDLLNTACGIAALVVVKKFMLYLMLQVFFTYCKNFYCSHKAKQMYPYITEPAEPLSKAERRNIFQNMRAVFIYKASSTLVTSTDNTLISILVSTQMVGFYSNYNMITANILMFMNIIFTQMVSSIGNLIIEGDQTKNLRVFRVMQQISFLLSTIGISCVMVLINDFIRVWLGERFVLSPLVVLAIVLNMYFSAVLMPIWSYRDATGIYRQTKYVMLMTALVNLVLSVLLGKWIGLAGILFATTIARLSTYFWYEPRLLFRQYFNVGVHRYYTRIAANIGITVLLTGALYALFSRFTPTGWLTLAVKMAVVLAVSLGATLLVYGRSEEFGEIRGILKKFLHRHAG